MLANYQPPTASLESIPTDLNFDIQFPCRPVLSSIASTDEDPNSHTQSPGRPMLTLIASAEEGQNKDRPLPVEMISKILVMAHTISPLPTSVMRVSRTFYNIAQPLIYGTIRLNRYTLRRITYDMRSDTRPYCAWMYGHKVAKARSESRARRLYSLQQATTLIIDDIPVLFQPKFDDMLRDFCQWITLPKVTKIIFCQEEGGLWERDELERWSNPRDSKGRIRRGLEKTRADIFSKVLTAGTKDVCVQIPPKGRFASLGYISRYYPDETVTPLQPIPHKPRERTISTSDRIMEYIEKFSGTVNLRIHQDVNYKRNLNHATIPATYVFRPFVPNPEVPGQEQVARSSSFMAIQHLAQYWNFDYRTAHDIGMIYHDLILAVDKPLDNHLPLIGQIERLRQLELEKGKTQDEAEKEFLMKVYQGASALHPDSTTPCPCCKEIGVPL